MNYCCMCRRVHLLCFELVQNVCFWIWCIWCNVYPCSGATFPRAYLGTSYELVQPFPVRAWRGEMLSCFGVFMYWRIHWRWNFIVFSMSTVLCVRVRIFVGMLTSEIGIWTVLCMWCNVSPCIHKCVFVELYVVVCGTNAMLKLIPFC